MNSELRFRQSIRNLVDTVFTHDMEYFDSLPEIVERELGTPMAALVPMIDESGEVERLIDAARLVDEIAAGLSDAIPADLSELILTMSRARSRLAKELGQSMT